MESVWEFILEPLQIGFMQRAILASILIGIVTGVMGTYVVTRGMAFLGDALAHSVLPGVALAFIAGNTTQGSLLIGGLVAGILSALGIGFLTREQRIQADTAIGIVFAGTLALGIGIISTARSYATDLTHILIGNILAVGPRDLTIILILSVTVLTFVTFFYKEMLVISFDPTLAQTLRLPAEKLRMILLILLAVTIVMGVETVGIALIAATLVTPAATARFFVRRLHHMMLLSAIIAATSGIVGMYAAWYLQIAASAAIVLVMTMLFIAAFLFAPGKGYFRSASGNITASA